MPTILQSAQQQPRRQYQAAVFRVFNLVMASLLLYVAVSIAYDFVYLPLVG